MTASFLPRALRISGLHPSPATASNSVMLAAKWDRCRVAGNIAVIDR